MCLLQQQDDGWFVSKPQPLAAGTRYLFRIDRHLVVPDPASRYQPLGVHGPSEVRAPTRYLWQHPCPTRPWREQVLYELHVGTFTAAGTFAAAQARLPELAKLGVTAIELMPLAEWSGRCNWGYDGVLLFAPHAGYGTPEELCALVDEAHKLNLAVLLDVVYNHLGPDGNYLFAYASPMFAGPQTPWGPGIDYTLPAVRALVLQNVIYWLSEFRFDGLRFDAVDAISDPSPVHLLTEVAERVAAGPGRERPIHLVLEDHSNASHWYRAPTDGRPALFAAQWNVDFQHALQHLLTGERGAYLDDVLADPIAKLGRAMAEGFSFQGERSEHTGRSRGERTDGLPFSAFVSYLQSHDQPGNRAHGDRLSQVVPLERWRAAQALLLLLPHVPMLFMGDDFGAVTPFPFFVDFPEELGAAVGHGRRARLRQFSHSSARRVLQTMPEPNHGSTFARAKLRWQTRHQAAGRAERAWTETLLQCRAEWLTPRLTLLQSCPAEGSLLGARALQVTWQFASGERWQLLANLGEAAVKVPRWPVGACVFSSAPVSPGRLPRWCVAWFLTPAIGM